MTDIQTLIQRHAETGRPPAGWHKAVNFLGWESPKGRRRYGRIDLLNEIQKHTCTRCGIYTKDIRWLRIGFFYDLTEVSKKLQLQKDTGLYVAPYCKDCRADFLGDVLRPWMDERIEPFS